ASGGLTNTTSTSIAVSPAAASALVFATQPANGTAGSTLGTQPVIKSQDAFGNNSAAGLPASLTVAADLSGGPGPFQGTTRPDIGTGGGNGTVSFADLRIDAAGTNKQITASASGLSSATSTPFTVSPANAASLVIQTQPPSGATAGITFST